MFLCLLKGILGTMKEKVQREGEEGKKEEEIEGKREVKPPQQTCCLFFNYRFFFNCARKPKISYH